MSFLKRVPADAWPGIALLLSAAAAMVIVNSAAGGAHQALLKQEGVIGIGNAAIAMPLSSWVKNALMAIFFFYAGLELKREMLEGALASPGRAALPFAAAVGGMALPAILYLSVAGLGEYKSGWAIPAATDIAFALGVLALLGPRVPAALKAFLLAVAVIDDLGAILIVAFVYTDAINTVALAWAGLFLAVLVAMNAARVKAIGPYVLGSLPLWVAMQESGINPTVAGVLAAATIPLRDRDGGSPLHDAEHGLRPYVLFGVMPLFALANAGAVLGDGLMEALAHPVAIGIALGLAAGKPLGILSMTLLFARVLRTPLPGTSVQLLGLALLAGIGFTMSLFIGALAFADPALAAPVRIGVYAGSLTAAVVGLAILAATLPAGARLAPQEDPARPFIAEEPAYAHGVGPKFGSAEDAPDRSSGPVRMGEEKD
jgi:NhaA family Na+:H+ antiporter